MSTAYAPRPGSVADRAITHLQKLAPGAELSSGKLAEAIGVDPNGLANCLAAAATNGDLTRREKGGHVRSPVFWSLPATNGKPARCVAPANGTPPPATTARPGLFWNAPAERDDNDAEIPERLAPQHVLKAEGASPDATDRGAPVNHSPVGGPMGAGQAAAAAPSGTFRVGLFSDGELRIEWRGLVIELEREQTEQLVRFLDRLAREVEA